MLNFTYKNYKLVSVSEDYSREAINRNDMKSMSDAEKIAADATTLTGKVHLAADKGAHTYPRYDVIAAPAVGDKVSRAFNGDYYPAGTIVRVSESFRVVTTDTGIKFYRVHDSASWRNARTWFMSAGWRDERNPSL